MGAAAISSKPEVEMIVFLAIMLHKAPAAFGLTTFLLQQVCLKLYYTFVDVEYFVITWVILIPMFFLVLEIIQ